MRKKLALLLALCVAVGTISTSAGMREVRAAEIGQGVEKGGVTFAETAEEIPEGYTPIYDIADLYAIRNDLEGNYILMNDIDMSEDTSPGGDYDCGTGWDSIEEFSGTLDGNGHRVIGMHIFGELDVLSHTDKAFGLFETTYRATIKNLGVIDCNIDISLNIISDGFAGFSGSIGIGTMVGVAKFGDLNSCFSSGSIRCHITNSTKLSYEVYAGGLTGYTSDRVENCYNICEVAYMADTGTANNTDIAIGGISGYCGMGISKCYNAGIIEGNEYGQVGAICGVQSYERENCIYLKGTAAQGIGDKTDDSNCVSLTEAQMKNAKLFTGFDFTETWEIDPYCSYPYPQLKNNRLIKINSIELNSKPQKLIYNQGENLNLDGAAIGITYEDGVNTMIPLAEGMLSGYDMKQIGAQTVTVTYGGRQTSFDIEVREVPVSSIKIPSMLTLNRSKSKQLNVTILPANASDKSVRWESGNPAVVSVDQNGVVKAKARGTAVITCTSVNGLQAKCTVTVMVPAVSVQISKTSLTLKEGQSSRITAKVLPLESTNTIEWESSNESVAEVYNGTIIAKKAGKATIKAYTENGVKASCLVTVQKNYDKEIKKVTSAKAKIINAKNVKGKTIRLKLKRMSDCNGFYIEYSVKKNFRSAKSGTINKKYTIVDIAKLKKGKTYYVRVRVYKKIGNKVYYGKWSNVKKVKVKK